MTHEEKSALATRCPGGCSCPRCGAAFVCGMATGEARCWCAELPPALPPLPDAASGCYCPTCLREIIGQREREHGRLE